MNFLFSSVYLIIVPQDVSAVLNEHRHVLYNIVWSIS
jgi:hypothetical protein